MCDSFIYFITSRLEELEEELAKVSNDNANFDIEILTNLVYLFVVCVFVYLFDAGNRLQQAFEKKQ